MSSVLMWGKTRDVSEFASLAEGEIKKLSMYVSLISGSNDPQALYGHYCNAVKICSGLYESAGALKMIMNPVALAIIDEVVNAKNKVAIESKDGIVGMTFDNLLPIRYFCGQESGYVLDFFLSPIRNALRAAQSAGKIAPYRGKVVLCVINHFEKGSIPIDYHEFEIKPIIDTMRQFLVRDDDWIHMACYSTGFCDTDKPYSEVFIVPQEQFSKYLTGLESRRKTLPAPVTGQKISVTECNHYLNELARQSRLFHEAYKNGIWNEMAENCSELILKCGQLLEYLKYSAYQENVGDFDIREANEIKKIDPGPLVTDEFLHYHLPGLIERHVSGQPQTKRRAIKRIPVEVFSTLKFSDNDWSNGAVVSFIYHVGSKARFRDHDNMATVAYAQAIQKALYGIKRVPMEYYMDCVMENGKESHTELSIIPIEQFMDFMAEKSK